MRNNLGKSRYWFVCACILLGTAGAFGALTISASVEPPADASITGNEQITIEFFVTSDVFQLIKGGQVGMFCSIVSGSTTLTVIPGGVTTGPSSAGGVGVLCPTGLGPTSPEYCFVIRSLFPLSPPCDMQPNQPYYMGSITYDVSDCAADPVTVSQDPADVADGVPDAADETRFRDDAPGLGNLVPIVASVSVDLVPELGTCCVSSMCQAAGVNQYCCEQGLYGGPPGDFNAGATSCLEPCECSSNGQCDDGFKCNGFESCNLGTGQCVPGTPPNCDDSDPCTADSCSEAAPGNGCVHDAAGANGAACGSSADTDCDNPDTCLNGVCQPNFETIGAPCDDGLFCTGVESCDGAGACNSSGDPCPFETCDEGGDVCIPFPCDDAAVVARGSRHLEITPAARLLPVALRVDGDAGLPSVACVSLYVQSDGSLDVLPHFALPSDWGVVIVHGEEIIPDSTYLVITDCGLELSDAVPAQTGSFADIDDSGIIDLDDLILLLEGFAGNFPLVPLSGVDLLPCDADGEIDLDDLLGLLGAFAGDPYSVFCSAPCP